MAEGDGEEARARFELLFVEHVDAVLAYALARTDPDTANDAVADTFLVAWRRLDDVPEPARPWLLGVTRRTLAGQYRSRKRQHRLVARLVTAWSPAATRDPHQTAGMPDPIESSTAIDRSYWLPWNSSAPETARSYAWWPGTGSITTKPQLSSAARSARSPYVSTAPAGGSRLCWTTCMRQRPRRSTGPATDGGRIRRSKREGRTKR